MGEDYQMAAELIGAWTIYASLCHFEPLFWQNSFVATYHEQIIYCNYFDQNAVVSFNSAVVLSNSL